MSFFAPIMNTSHYDGGAPDLFSKKTPSAITAADINATTVVAALRRKFIELPLLDGPDGKPLSWDTLVVNKGKKRVKLQVPVDPDHKSVQKDWADCEYLHWHINRWFEDLGSGWSFTFEEGQK